jgi:hypothetical protein
MSSAASTPPAAGDLQITTPLQWAHELERDLGDPQNPNNDAVLVAWAQLEGGHWHNSAYGNPLGTTKREPGSTSINSVGVQRYTSWREGLAATVAMIRQGNMAGIAAALAKGGNPADTATAIGDSPWLNGHTSAPGTSTAYGNRIISLLGRGYTPSPTQATPSPGSGSAAGIQNASLLTDGLSTLVDPFGLLGGAAGAAGSVGGKIAGGLLGDVEDYIGKFAIRAALVVFGAIFVLVGLSVLFRGGDTEHSETETETDGPGGETETRSSTQSRGPAERQERRQGGRSSAGGAGKGKSGGAAADVEETAEGAAEAV